MAWECASCRRSISHDHDPRDHGKEPICWHCLYQHREALLEACEALLACEVDPRSDRAKEDELTALLMIREATALTKGGV